MKLIDQCLLLGFCLSVALYKFVSSFTCDDGCEVPDHYEDDNFCDCPDCSDEIWYECDSCYGGCPSGCNATIGDHYCYENQTWFTCDNGCRIHRLFEDDSFCDCPDCEDEAEWDCTTCNCTDTCGDFHYCYDDNYYTYNFTCSDDCVIPISWVDDSWCDCSDCGDEEEWTCNTCECPDDCGEYNYCNGDYTPESNNSYVCSDGCVVPIYWVDDSYCDCSDCGDESEWDCSNCLCPTECGEYNYCGDSGFYTYNYTCSDGCTIPGSWSNDGWCDCSDCGDEDDWNCNNCDCPTSCGEYYYCDGSYANFTCLSDGCVISAIYVDDNHCHCSDCSDEDIWTCDTCDGCPTTCIDSGNQGIQCTNFTCNDGSCHILGSWVNDNWCDCSECEDESYWTCNNCDCPTTCGDYEYCGTPNSLCSTGNFTCSDGCSIPCVWTGDDWCDCNDCEDEALTGWDCTNCDCPDECGEYNYCDGYGGTGESSDDGSSSSSSSSSAFNQNTDAGRAALAVLIIGIIILFVIGGIVISKQLKRRDLSSLQDQKQGIIDLDGNAGNNGDGVGMGMVGTNNGTLTGPNSEPDKYNDGNNNNNNATAGSGGGAASNWNETIDLPDEDEPQNTNDNDDDGELNNDNALPEKETAGKGDANPFDE